MRCYDLALGSLGNFNDAHGVTSDADYNEVVALREEAWGVAFESKDSAFHARLYDWCMERELTDILLNVSHSLINAQYNYLTSNAGPYTFHRSAPLETSNL
jgi:hypothetical protein